MNNPDQQRWNERYQDTTITQQPQAAKVLLENSHLLPASGDSLDLACGLGGNAIFLSQQGLESYAWDISTVAINMLDNYARQHSIILHTQVRDLTQNPPEPESFDIITVNHYLERELCPVISQALKPGGLLYYQTYSQQRVSDKGPSNPVYRLAPNELLQLFPQLQIIVYREEGRVGDAEQGWRDEAMLVSQKV
jgi:SAM-dependent methyltransferase